MTATGNANKSTAVGYQAGYNSTHNVDAFGSQALYSNTTGVLCVAIGREALRSNTTASNNTAVGYQSSYSNTTGTENSSFGRSALVSNTTGNYNTTIGSRGSDNYATMNNNTTGSNNVAVGNGSLARNTTASYNTAVGYQSGYSNTTGARNVTIGPFSGYLLTTGTQNTFVGAYATGAGGAGGSITTGSKNTILGKYTGNQGGLDIRTSDNNIVLSDGDGNPRLYLGPDGDLYIGCTSVPSATVSGFSVQDNAGKCYVHQATNTTGNNIMTAYINPNGTVGGVFVNGSSTTYSTSSDYRLKENVVELTGATDRLKQLNPSRFNFIADADTTVDGFLAHEVQSVVPEAITGTHNEVDDEGNPVYQGIDQSKLVPLLVATIQELEARITALENA